MPPLDFNLTNLEQRASNPDGTEGEGLSHKTGGIGGAGMVLMQVLELAPPFEMLVDGEPRGAAILVHDIGDHGARYEDLAAALAEAGLIVSLPDLRGHGRSEGPRGHVPGLPEPVRDLHAVREHVAYRMPDAKSLVVGIGAGALIATAYAKAHRDEVHGLVLVGPLLEPSFGAPKPAGLFGRFKKPGPLSECAIPWTAADLLRDPGAQTAWTGDERRGGSVTLRTAEVLALAAREVAKGYQELGLATLVIAGSEDPLSSLAAAKGLATELGAEFLSIEGGRHDLLRDAGSDAVIAQLVSWATAKLLEA